MQQLIHPILHDLARIVDRHPDLSPQFKHRLLAGMAEIDQQIRPGPEPVEPKAAKAGKR